MTRYFALGGVVCLAFMGLYIALLRSDLRLATSERDILKITLQANIQFIANDTKRRQQNEEVTQGQLVDLANDKGPNRNVGPLLGGVIERLPSPKPFVTPLKPILARTPPRSPLSPTQSAEWAST